MQGGAGAGLTKDGREINSMPRTAVCWMPKGSRKRGWPKITWRRMVKTEPNTVNTLGESSRERHMADKSGGTLSLPSAPRWAYRA